MSQLQGRTPFRPDTTRDNFQLGSWTGRDTGSLAPSFSPLILDRDVRGRRLDARFFVAHNRHTGDRWLRNPR